MAKKRIFVLITICLVSCSSCITYGMHDQTPPFITSMHAEQRNPLALNAAFLAFMDNNRSSSSGQERADAEHFFGERYITISAQAGECLHDPYRVWEIWEQEERELQELKLNSSVMQEQCRLYQSDIAKEKEMIAILIRSQQRAQASSDWHEIIQLTRSGDMKGAQEALKRVGDVQDRKLKRITNHEGKGRRSSVGLLHCTVSLSILSCAAYGFYKLCQSMVSKETTVIQPLEEFILTFNEDDASDQDRVRHLLHQVACQILACIDTITNKEKAIALKEIHARIIVLTAHPITKDELVEIIERIKSLGNN